MEKKTALPKNVRQIGDIQGDKRIYLEDYVVTYIHKKEKQEEKEGFLGVFLGEVQREKEEIRMFIRGLLDVSLDRWATEEKQPDTDPSKQECGEAKRRRTIPEECRDYFGEMEVIGCCVIGKYPVEPMKKLMEEVPQSRMLLYHLQDQEEHLYWTETGKYEEISGYFVFYEQNRNMQEYMAEVFHEKSEDKERITDQAIKVFREKIKKKDQMHTAGMMKLASSFFVVTLLVIGAVVVTRIGNIRNPERAANGTGTGNASVNGTAAAGNVDAAGNLSVAGRPDTAALETGPELLSDSMPVSGTADAAAEADPEMPSDSILVSGMADVTEMTEAEQPSDSVPVSGTADVTAVTGAEQPSDSMPVSGTADITEVTEAEQPSDSAPVSGTADVGTAAEDETENAGTGEAAVEASAQVRQTKATYVIREGDTLADICQKYYGGLNKLEELCQENGIQDANKIMPGQKITLP